MAKIKVNKLRAISTEFIDNSASFMNKLSHEKSHLIVGGIPPELPYDLSKIGPDPELSLEEILGVPSS